MLRLCLLVLAAIGVAFCPGAWSLLAHCAAEQGKMPDVEGPVRTLDYQSQQAAEGEDGWEGQHQSQPQQQAQQRQKAHRRPDSDGAAHDGEGPALLPDAAAHARPLKGPGDDSSGDGAEADHPSADQQLAPPGDQPVSGAQRPIPADKQAVPAEKQPAAGDQQPQVEETHPQPPPPVDGPVLPGVEPPAGKPGVMLTPNGVRPTLPPIEEPPADTAEPSEGRSKPLPSQAEPSASPDATKPPAPVQPPRPLTPAQAALRDRLRRVVGFYQAQALNPQEHTATELLYAATAFGCNTEVQPPGGKKLNGITYLCWNLPCAGRELLTSVDGRIAARVGYTFQAQPGQMLAVLAMARVPRNYPMRAGDEVRSVADLVEYEKLSCRAGSELSLKLIGLSYYVEEPVWQNDMGEDWSLERIVGELLAQPTATLSEGGTARLLALTAAINHRQRRNQPIEGRFAQAQQLLDRFQAIAFDVQNADGSWGPTYFAGRSASREPAVQLNSTGQMLRWLVRWTPSQQLDDPRIVRSVQYLLEMLGGQRYSWNLRAMSTREIAAVMHALDALSAYDERLSGAFTTTETSASTRAPAATGAGDTPPSQQPQRTAAGSKPPAGRPR